MSRNLDCRCLCHGSDGNRIGDEYFSCKNCYAANHMNALPRKVVPHKPAPRKPKVESRGIPVQEIPVRKPGENPVFDTLTNNVDEALNGNDPDDSVDSRQRNTERLVGFTPSN